MVKTRDINKIVIPKKSWKKQDKYTEIKKCVGLDTETVKGKAFILGHYDGFKFYWCRINTFDDVLNYFIYHNLENYNNFFYNLEYDTNALIKLMPTENLKELALFDETLYKEYEIKIIPKKCLIIKKEKLEIKFYDIMQFYGFLSLKNAGKKILNKEKIELDVKDLNIKKFDEEEEYKQEVIKYFEMDCVLSQELAEHFIKLVRPYMNIKNFYSQASLSQQYFLENMPRDYAINKKYQLEMALKCYQGGRFEVMKRGTYKAYSYDIKSAYPYHNTLIPALDNGKWIYNKEYEDNALISMYEIEVEGYSHISPLKYDDTKSIIYPVGKIKTFVNKSEYETIKEYGYKIRIVRASHYKTENPEYPYLFLKDFYDKKEEVGKNHPSYLFYKIIINGFYGKTIQLNKNAIEEEKADETINDINISEEGIIKFTNSLYKAGLLFNPIVAQEITGNTRSQLLKAVIDEQYNIISFATDGIKSTKPLNKLKIGKNLGEWDDETPKNKKFTCIGNGIYFYEGEKSRFRGFGKQINIMDMNINKNSTSVKIPITRNQKLKATFKAKDLNLEKFNVIEPDEKELNFNFDKKRIWQEDFKTFDDIFTKQINSKPHYIDI